MENGNVKSTYYRKSNIHFRCRYENIFSEVCECGCAHKCVYTYIYTHVCTYTSKLCILELLAAIAVMRVQCCHFKIFLDNNHQKAKDLKYPSVVKVHS